MGFIIMNKIGNGGQGNVFKVWDSEKDEEYAIKKFIRSKFSREFQNEINILKKIKDMDNVLKLVDYYKDDKHCNLVTPFYPGLDLFEYVENYAKESNSGRQYREKMEKLYPFFENIFFKLLKCVDELHARGILHRDVKSENVILDGENVVLIDFTTAFDLEKTDEDFLIMLAGTLQHVSKYLLEITYLKSTEERKKIGKEKYIEAYKYQDYWGIVSIIYILLTGCDPIFSDQSNEEVRRSILNSDFIPISEMRDRKLVKMINSILLKISFSREIFDIRKMMDLNNY